MLKSTSGRTIDRASNLIIDVAGRGPAAAYSWNARTEKRKQAEAEILKWKKQLELLINNNNKEQEICSLPFHAFTLANWADRSKLGRSIDRSILLIPLPLIHAVPCSASNGCSSLKATVRGSSFLSPAEKQSSFFEQQSSLSDYSTFVFAR